MPDLRSRIARAAVLLAAVAVSPPLLHAADRPGADSLAPVVRLPAAPLERAWLEATPLSWGSQAKVFHLEPTARALTLAGLPAGMTMICLGAEGRAPRCQRERLAAGLALDLAEPLHEGMRVAGRLMLGRRPAAGLRISVAPAGLIARRPFSLPLARAADGGGLVREVVSDARGRYSIPPLAPGRYILEARSPGGRDAQSEPFTVVAPVPLRRRGDGPAQPPAVNLGEWALDEGVTLPVSVADAAGLPIAGAEVAALQGEQSVSRVRTGGDGRASLTRLDPGLTIAVGCSAAGYARSDQSFERPPAEVRCRLVRRASLEGRLLGEDDEPIAGATLTLQRSQRATTSDSAGAFAFASLAPGHYRLVAAAPGYRALERELDVLAGERRSLGALRLAPADRLFGRVVDAASGEAVAGAAIAVAEPAGGGSATADEGGRFSLAAASASGLGLEVRAGGFPAKRVDVDPAAGRDEDEPLVIQLTRGGRVQVLVWDEAADAPCFGCTVDLTGHGAGLDSLVTDAHGEATSELLDPGGWDAYLETVESAGSTVRVHSGDVVRHVTVDPGGVSRVEFGRRLTLRVGFTSPLPSGWMLAGDSGALHSSVPPGPDGTFEVRRAGGEPMVLALVDPSLRRIQQAVVPADYADAVLTLPLPATSVSGVLAHDTAPPQDRVVTLVGAAAGLGAASTVADGQGAFSIPFVPPGLYTLLVEGRPLREVEVSEGTSMDLGVLHLPG